LRSRVGFQSNVDVYGSPWVLKEPLVSPRRA
jgi:hypothetical protein